MSITDRLRAAYDAVIALPSNVDGEEWAKVTGEMVAAQEAAYRARCPDRVRWAMRDSFERRLAEKNRARAA